MKIMLRERCRSLYAVVDANLYAVVVSVSSSVLNLCHSSKNLNRIIHLHLQRPQNRSIFFHYLTDIELNKMMIWLKILSLWGREDAV